MNSECDKQGVIYLIIINDTCEQYVGQTRIGLEKRIHHHHAYGKTIVDNKMRSHGYDFMILEKCPVDILSEREKHFISLFTTFHNYNCGGLNMTVGGERDFSVSESTKIIISTNSKNMWSTPGYFEKMSEIQKKKWGDPLYASKQKQIMVEGMQTPEYHLKRSEIAKQLWEDETFRQKISEKRNVTIQTKEYSEKQSKNQKDKWNRREFREKRHNTCMTAESKSKRGSCVVQLDKDTGELINAYLTMTDAAKAVGHNYTNISACCAGRIDEAYGYKWCSFEDYIFKDSYKRGIGV